ncbi:MAG: hypothetical protein JSU92_12080 [Deltaproteobacteria bacterium]|nr:MAG: hypothetical protein JSU92_12080 [Deltaproteobacteria bacterium]
MKKSLLFGMGAVVILAVGMMLNCDCDDDETNGCTQAMTLTAAQTSISADDSDAGSTVTITATLHCAGEVSFAVANDGCFTGASVSPATATAVADGDATTELTAGTLMGDIVVTATVGNLSEEVTVTVNPGVAAGLDVVDGIEQYICCECTEFAVQLVDAFGNAAPESAVDVTLTAESEDEIAWIIEESEDTVTVATDAAGQGVFEVCYEGEGELDITAAVTVPASTVGLTLTTRDYCDLGSFLEGQPAFRAVTLAMHADLVRCEDECCSNCIGDHTCNSMGGPVIGSFVNPELQGALDNGDANIIFVFKGLEYPPDDLMVDAAVVGGLCGAPAGPEMSCTGDETEFFVDPTFYDADTGNLNLMLCGLQVTDGASDMELGSLDLPFPADPEPVVLELCNLYASTTVSDDEETASGELSGSIPEVNLQNLVEAMMPGMWELAKSMIGEADTLCKGEPAYSVRMEFTSEIVELHELPD